MTEYQYVGSELDLFAHARNWKAHFGTQIRPYLGPRVLEVGAGSGGTTAALAGGDHERWVCLEPDADLVGLVDTAQQEGTLPSFCESQAGTLNDLPESDRFDTVLYIDVLEHIEDDLAEVASAARFLASGGHLVVLCPAHSWLYTPFDKAIGHFRRYNKRMMRQFNGPSLRRVCLRYLDSAGLLASLGNSLLLRQSMPTARQIRIWDRWLVPVSRWTDPLTCYLVGKSILGVWVRQDAAVLSGTQSSG